VWVAILAVAALLVASIVVIRSSASAANDRLDAAQKAIAGLSDGLDDQAAATNDLVTQLREIQSSLEAQPDTSAIARKAKRSIFTVRATTSTDVSLGSAFVVAGVGGGSELVTNFHVIANVWSLGRTDVEVLKGDATYEGLIARTNAAEDLAVIEVQQHFTPLRVAPTQPHVGDSIIVIGSPYGLQGSVVEGVISAYRGRFLQLSAPVSPGDSGAPVIDMDGRVVAVVVSKIVDQAGEGVAFAIPINSVCGQLASC
jgi:putative serine protease PepD